MTADQFKATLADPTPPADANPVLRALWHDANGDFAAAHDIAQEGEGTAAFDRLHAYLHRKEGDAGNAAYWYRRAGAKVYTGAFDAEWADLIADQLK